MAEHNTSLPVGAAQSFGQAWAPCTGDIGTNMGNWSYGGGCAYPAPYRSFQQNLINGNNYLGPYCRRLDGVAGRLKVSLQAAFGEIGFAQQCWYDYPRGANDKVNGVLADTNKVWWDTKVSRKYWVRVYNLNDDNAPLIWVQVAISAGTSSYPVLSMHDESNGPLQGECIKLIRAGHNLYGGQVNPAQLYTGISGNCGIKADSLSELAIPYSAANGAWLPNLSFLDNGSMGGFGYHLAPGSEMQNLCGAIYNSLSGSDQSLVGSSMSDANRASTFATALADHLTNVQNYLAALRGSIYNNMSGMTSNEIAQRLIDLLFMLPAAPMAANLMMEAWYAPNVRKYGGNPNNLPDGTSGNPYIMRPQDHVQQRWAGHMRTVSNSNGAPSTVDQYKPGTSDKINSGAGKFGDARDYIHSSTPTDSANGYDWAWHLTLLNRGNWDDIPYVDPNTNEFVFHEYYGFGRGESVASADPFINWVESKTDTQTANAIGALTDMSPATGIFIMFGIAGVLEDTAKMIKRKKGQTIGGISNLDGYDTTTFQIRISAKNMKAGNPALYNYLVNTGLPDPNDSNTIKKFTAVP